MGDDLIVLFVSKLKLFYVEIKGLNVGWFLFANFLNGTCTVFEMSVDRYFPSLGEVLGYFIFFRPDGAVDPCWFGVFFTVFDVESVSTNCEVDGDTIV